MPRKLLGPPCDVIKLGEPINHPFRNEKIQIIFT